MKRIISLILAVVFIVSMAVATVPSVSAKENLNVSLTNAACKPGETFTVDFKINSNPGVWALWFMMYYDSETFILRDCKLNDDFADDFDFEESDNNAVPERMTGPIADRILAQFDQYGVSKEDKLCKIIMISGKDIADVTKTGTVVTFTFEVNGDGIAKEGDLTIGLIPDKESIINSQGNGEYVPFTWSNATVTVSGNPVAKQETQAPIEPLEPIEVDEEADTTATETTERDLPETFVGEDGVVYYTDDNGETVEFDEKDFMTPEEIIYGTTADETTAEEYLEGEGDTATHEVDKETKTILWIVVAAVLVLVAVAAILFVFLGKSKKDTKKLEEGANPFEGSNTTQPTDSNVDNNNNNDNID